MVVGNLALKKKGLRLYVRVMCYHVFVGNLALKKKGLRPGLEWPPTAKPCWKPCPEEKGIKTNPNVLSTVRVRWKPCPEEKGIKTFPEFPYSGSQQLETLP